MPRSLSPPTTRRWTRPSGGEPSRRPGRRREHDRRHGLARGRLGSPSLRIVDTRWYTDPARQRARRLSSPATSRGGLPRHGPKDLSAPGGGRGRPAGRHPWPSADQVARVLSGAGIADGTRVGAYDDQAGAIAARLVYVLRAYGHDDVAILDGGLAKWTAEGRALETVVPPGGAGRLRSPSARGLGPEQGGHGPRALERARARRAGRTAVSRGRGAPRPARRPHPRRSQRAPTPPTSPPANCPYSGRTRSCGARYEALGAGRESSDRVLRLRRHRLPRPERAGAGRSARPPYPGSWSEWSADPALPAATERSPSFRRRAG